jgi:hypothetical protein
LDFRSRADFYYKRCGPCCQGQENTALSFSKPIIFDRRKKWIFLDTVLMIEYKQWYGN